MGSLQKEWFGYIRSDSRNPSSVFGTILHLLFILDPRRSLRLSNLHDTNLSLVLGVSLASFLLVVSSHCQIALDKLTFLSLRFLGFHLCHVPCILSRFLFLLSLLTLSSPAPLPLTWTSMVSLLPSLPL